MAEATLTLSLTNLRDRITEYVYGGNSDYSTMTTAEKARVDRILDSGLRQFYQPPIERTGGRAHEWSFLTTTATITMVAAYSTGTLTVASGVATLVSGTFPSWAASGMLRVEGTDYSINTRDSDTQVTLDDLTLTDSSVSTWEVHQDDYDLPDAFGHMTNTPPTYAQADDVWHEVQIVGEARIRSLRQRDILSAVDKPYLAAIRTKNKATASGTRQEIMFYPRVTDAATFTYRYRARADALGTSDTYAWGASDHSETILASCLAAAELLVEESRGAYWDQFQQRLAASIAFDGRANRPERLGYNGDNSDDGGEYGDPWSARDYRRSNSLTPVTHTAN